MRTLIKSLAGVVAVIVLLAGAATLYLLTVFDPNDYKTDIQELVKQQTQLDLVIDGQLSLSVFPWLGISVGKIDINSPDGPLASADHTQIYARLRPLLNGELEISGLTLKGLQLKLIVDESGKGNWIIETSSATDSPAKPVDDSGNGVSPNTGSPMALPLAALSIGHVSIEQASIDYHDMQKDQRHHVRDLDLRIGKINLDQPFPVSADFSYDRGKGSQAIPVHITSQVNTIIARQMINMNDTVIDIDTTRLVGQINVSNLLQNPMLDAQLNIDGFQPYKWSQLLNLPALAGVMVPMNMETVFTFDAEDDQLEINTLKINSGNLSASGALSIAQASTAAKYSGNLTVNPFDLQNLLSQFGMEPIATRDKTALKQVSAELTLKGDQTSLNLPSVSLKIDNTQVKGSVGINNFDRPAYTYNLKVNAFNLDNYLPEKQTPPDDKTTTNDTSSINAGEALLLPIAAMRDLNINGKIELNQLIASGLTLENINARTSARNGFIRLDSMTGNVYDGTFKANGTIDARGKSPQITVKKQLRNMNAGPVLQALGDIDYVTGKLDMDITATTYGDTREKITSNLNGDIQFSVADGALRDISLEDMVCDGIARIRQIQGKPPRENPVTQFRTLNGRMTISNGIIHADKLDVGTDSLSARGAGIINLNNQTLDIGLDARVLGELENKSCEVHERYRDIEWPVICQGPWEADPADICTLDRNKMGGIIGKLLEQELKQETGKKIEDVLKEKLGEDVSEQLKELFKF